MLSPCQRIPILHHYLQTCQPEVALHVSNVSRSKMESSSLCSLPPSSIFPSVFCILVNGTFIPPAVHASNLGVVLDTSLLHLHPNTKLEYFRWMNEVSASVFLLQRGRIPECHWSTWNPASHSFQSILCFPFTTFPMFCHSATIWVIFSSLTRLHEGRDQEWFIHPCALSTYYRACSENICCIKRELSPQGPLSKPGMLASVITIRLLTETPRVTILQCSSWR